MLQMELNVNFDPMSLMMTKEKNMFQSYKSSSI